MAIILFCVTTIFLIKKTDVKKSIQKSPFWLLSLLYYTWLLISFTWEKQEVNVFKSMEIYASFLFLIPSIAINPTIDQKSIKRINEAFVMSVIAGCVICYVRSTLEYLDTGDYRVFYYHYLSSQIMINAIYLSLYCSYSFFCIICLTRSLSTFSKLKKIYFIFAALLLSVTILLLSSKTVIAIHVFLTFGVLLAYAARKGKLMKGVILLVVVSIAGLVLISQMPYVKWRIQTTLVKKYEGKQDDQNGLAVRQRIWELAIHLIKEKPLTGYGLKSGYTYLVDEYKKRNFQVAAEAGYNAHNNYLQILLLAGIPGFLLLLSLLITGLFKGLKQKNLLLSILMILIISLAVTECVLEVHKGIVFFGLFAPLMIYHGGLKVSKQKPETFLNQDNN